MTDSTESSVMYTGIKIGVSSYVSIVTQEGIFLCGGFPARTDITVLLLMPVIYSDNLWGCKNLPITRAQTNITALHKFTFSTNLENVR